MSDVKPNRVCLAQFAKLLNGPTVPVPGQAPVHQKPMPLLAKSPTIYLTIPELIRFENREREKARKKKRQKERERERERKREREKEREKERER